MDVDATDARAVQLFAGLAAMDVPASRAQVLLLLRHLDLLTEVNRTTNLTRIDPESAVQMHVLDSLACWPEVMDAPAGAMVDLGAGAGFPGVPLAVLARRKLTLVEATGKKARFLERVVSELRLDATVLAERAEEAAPAHRGEFTVALARAVSALPSLVELASPLLTEGGILMCLKGSPGEEEFERGRVAAGLCGMMEIGSRAVVVPGLEAARTVVSYRKVASPRVRLPRRAGMAQRQPLA
jgi:16S rRNA (guanine527-N7)-methyltransferase